MFTAIGGFFSGIFGWMVKNPTIMLLGIFAAMFLMVVISKNSEIATLEKASAAKDTRITALVSDNTTLKNNNTVLASSVATQNAALKGLNDKAGLLDARFDTVLAQLAAGNAAITTRISAIRSAKPGPDRCQSAVALVRSSTQ